MKFKKLVLSGFLAFSVALGLMTLKVNAVNEEVTIQVEDKYYTSTNNDVTYDLEGLAKYIDDNGDEQNCHIISNDYVPNQAGTYTITYQIPETDITKDVEIIVVEPQYEIVSIGSNQFPFELTASNHRMTTDIYFNQKNLFNQKTLQNNEQKFFDTYHLEKGYYITKNLKTGEQEKHNIDLVFEAVSGYDQVDGYGDIGEQFLAMLPESMYEQPSISTNEADFELAPITFEYSIWFHSGKAPVIHNKTSKVKITNTNNAFHPSATLETKDITLKEDVIKKLNAKNYIAYDISLVLDHKKIEPNGEVEVSLDIPSHYDHSKIKVYYELNGSLTDMNAIVQDHQAVFKTTHFSNYILVEENPVSVQVDEKTDDTKTQSTQSNHQNESTITTTKEDVNESSHSNDTSNQAKTVETADDNYGLLWVGLLMLCGITLITFKKKTVK